MLPKVAACRRAAAAGATSRILDGRPAYALLAELAAAASGGTTIVA
jgi:acetylglutamate kinase